jgi:hypothetical protein
MGNLEILPRTDLAGWAWRIAARARLPKRRGCRGFLPGASECDICWIEPMERGYYSLQALFRSLETELLYTGSDPALHSL